MKDLKEKLALHKEWLLDDSKGMRIDIRNANLRNANLRNADLSNADLRNADLRNANLRNVNLRNVNLRNADLIDTSLRYASLSDANLSGADLSGANLSDADLRYCIGNNKEIKSLQIGTYLISYTKDILNIGCQSHTLDKWINFTDEEIDDMDKGTSLDWWKLNKDILVTLVKREIQ